MPYKTFVAGEEALAADVNSYLQSQVVARFLNAAARTAQLPAPVLNQLSSRDDRPGGLEYWNGTAWADISEIAYNQVTASVTINTAVAAGANLLIADAARAYDGSPIMIEYYAPVVNSPNVASGNINFNLFDGATDLGWLGTFGATAPITQAPVYLRRRVVPTVGSHTYRIGAYSTVGSNGVVVAGAGGPGAYPPAFMRITRA